MQRRLEISCRRNRRGPTKGRYCMNIYHWAGTAQIATIFHGAIVYFFEPGLTESGCLP